MRRPGRMNAAGISAFYGCADVNTCVAEIRAPVGSTAVVGKFKFLRKVRLLDLRQLDESSPATISWFDDDFAEKRAYVDFMRGLHDEIRKPILPGAEAFDYLPTQLIAEYLANRDDLELDGLLFWSSLTTREKNKDEQKGLNVVLFAHASIVADDRSQPHFEVTHVRPPLMIKNLRFPRNHEHVARKRIPGPIRIDVDEERENVTIEPTLAIVENALHVVRVRAIEYVVLDSDVDFTDRDGDEKY